MMIEKQDLPPHVQRMQDEAYELGDRLTKLHSFIYGNGPVYASLPQDEQALLKAQAGAMATYQTILLLRMSRAQATIGAS